MANLARPAKELILSEAEKVAPLLTTDGITIDIIDMAASRTPNVQIEGRRLAFDLKCDGLWIRTQPGALVCIFSFAITLNATSATAPEEGSTEGSAIEFCKISASYRIGYEFREPVTDIADDTLEHFVGIYGLTHVWPYWRHEVQTATTRFVVPPLTLPLLRYGRLPAGFSLRQVKVDSADMEQSGDA